MKKLILLLSVITILSSCNDNVATNYGVGKLQSIYPKSTIFGISPYEYIVVDSLHTYYLRVDRFAEQINNTVLIK